jgi:hypothetical protein
MRQGRDRPVKGGEAGINYEKASRPVGIKEATKFTYFLLTTALLLAASTMVIDFLALKDLRFLEENYFRVTAGLSSVAGYREAAQRVDSLGPISGLTYFLSLAIFLLALIQFVYRMYRRYPALGARGLRYGFHQAIWTWFVPIVNLFRPKQILNDLWRMGSAPDFDEDPRGWRLKRSIPAFLTIWWLALILVNWLDTNHALRYSASYSQGLPSFEVDYRQIDLIFESAWMLIIGFTIYVVKRLSALFCGALEEYEARLDARGSSPDRRSV